MNFCRHLRQGGRSRRPPPLAEAATAAGQPAGGFGGGQGGGMGSLAEAESDNGGGADQVGKSTLPVI